MGLETEGQKEHQDPIGDSKGCDSASKFRGDDTLSDWFARKEAKRSKSTGFNVSKRTGLNRGGQIKKTALNKVSKKQKKKNSEYKKARESHYSKESNQVCFICGRSNNISIHHSRKRGGNTSNEETFFTLCLIGNFADKLYPNSNHSHSGGCHGWVEGNKSIAREIGLLI